MAGTENRTLVLCKPDCVERGLVGEILDRFEPLMGDKAATE